MRTKRFFYTGPKGGKLHMCFDSARVEGSLTACGVRLRTSWHWYAGKQSAPKNAQVCKKCRPD